MEWSQTTVFKLPKRVSEWGCDAAKKNVSVETNPSQVSYLRHEDKCLFSRDNITTEKGLSFMKIYYEEVPLYALIDSGSTISLAGPKLFQQFPSLRQLLKPYDCEALTVCNCIPDAKRGYYGFIIVGCALVRVRRDFLLATYSPHFFPDFFHIWQVA